MTEQPAQPAQPKKRGPRTGHEQEFVKVGVVVGRGRVPVPREEVLKLARLGCTLREIAGFFGVTDDAISRNFRDELEVGRADQRIRLRQAMMHNACENMNPALQIFLAKNILHMSDNGITNEDRPILPWSDDE
jgi:hypothetical protein